jgi:hypothetical protein
MRHAFLAVAASLALVPLATGQFSQFTWTQINPGGFLMFASPTQLALGGGSGSAGGQAWFTAQAHVDALVTATGTTIATPKGDCGDSHGWYGVPGQLQVLSDCQAGVPLSFSVHSGEAMYFGMTVIDSTLPGDVYYTNFAFKPYWQPLGGGLAGAAGVPSLAGAGVLEPGELVRFTLTGAAPSAGAVFVLGIAEANLPFKGGVMVPAPSLIVFGPSTNAAGSLTVGSLWSAAFPSHFTLVTQVWVADAGAPAGWAASNAVKALAY